jgi:hypothetical protein
VRGCKFTPDIALARDAGKLPAEASAGYDNFSCRSQSTIVVSFVSPLSFNSFGFLALLVLMSRTFERLRPSS